MSKQRRNLNIVKNAGITLLSEGKSIRIKAHGYSMYPCIKPGSLILIEPLKIKGPPLEGEIIAIKRKQGLVVHRLSRIVHEGGTALFIARGDSNAYADKAVTIDRIAGRIVGAETTGENQVKADIKINRNPKYILNRLRVLGILIWKKLGK